MFDKTTYTIGWVCALRTELVAAIEHLDKEHDFSDYEAAPSDNNTYVFGNIGKHNIVIATLPRDEYGISSAANVARDMIRSFTNVRIGLMVGIGGGAPLMAQEEEESQKQDVRLGDVVVSTPGNASGGVLQYGYGKTIQGQEFKLTGHLNAPPPALLGAVNVLGADFERKGNRIHEDVAILLEKNKKIRKTYDRPDQTTDCLFNSSFVHVGGGNCSGCDKAQCISRAPREEDVDIVIVHDGLIASADQLMKDALIRDKLAREKRVLCFEMEASGLMNQLPFLVIRGICDYSDTHKNKEWQGYAAMTAANYARKLLLRLSPAKVAEQTQFSELKDIKEQLQMFGLNLDVIRSDLSLNNKRSLDADIERWLAAPNPETNFRIAMDQREPGTGQWLVESEVYRRWKAGNIRHLWLHGKAGCGKSIISASIVEDIRGFCADDANAACAIFYFTFSDNGKQSKSDCLRSLVHQLSGDSSVSASLEQLYRTDKPQRLLSMDESLQEILINAIKAYKKFFLVLDALDESPETDSNADTRRKLLEWLRSLSLQLPMLQILATSRRLQDIEIHLTEMNFHPEDMIVGCVNIDIIKYVEKQLSNDIRLRALDADIKAMIQDTFREKADGMFLWAALQINYLKRFPSTRRNDLERVLNNLPATLDDTYSRMISRIPQELHRDASVLLRWLIYSDRPLTLLQLSETRIINPDLDQGNVDFDNRGRAEDVLGILSDLILPLESKEELLAHRTVRLAHFSVQEYLESPRESIHRLPLFYFTAQREHQFISDCCVVYLTHYANSPSASRTEQDLQRFPLLDYAARSWYFHCQKTDNVAKVTQFLQSAAFLDSLLVYDPRTLQDRSFWTPPGYEPNRKGSGLSFAAFFGLSSVSRELIKAGADVNAQGGPCRNALQAAVNGGYDSIVKMLIDAGAEFNAHDGLRGNALQAAANRGYDSIVKMLIDAGADVHAQGGLYGNALEAAAEKGHESIVRMLIEARADVNAQDGSYGSALPTAIDRGHESIVEMLIDAGADVNAQDERYGNALRAAIDRGYEPILKMLIEAGADFPEPDEQGRTLLHYAARRGNAGILQLFVEMRQTQLDVKDKHGRTILDYACMSGNEQTVKFVLDLHETNLLSVQQTGGFSPMHWACRKGTFQCLELLGSANIHITAVESKQPPGSWTPLDIAVYHCNRNLITKDGELDRNHDWQTLTSNGLVSRLDTSDEVVMVRKNSFYPGGGRFMWYCHGCFMFIHGNAFACLTCTNYLYCFMCKPTSEAIHPGHEWEWIPDEENVDSCSDEDKD